MHFKIIALQAKNIKRIEAVEIKPDGHVVVVGGQNKAGKSSVLDSIAYTLGGKDLIPGVPLRQGEAKGHVTVELASDDGQKLKVRRTFSERGTTSLKVTTADGSTPASPQTLLNTLCGKIAFDPLEFTRLGPQKQAETLRGLVGLDFTAHDTVRRSLFDERSGVNRDAKAARARLDAAEFYDGMPAEEVSVINLTKELSLAQATNRAKEEACSKVKEGANQTLLAAKEVERTAYNVEIAQEELRKAQAERNAAASSRTERDKEVSKLKAAADAMIADDCQPILDKIAASDETNTKVRSNIARKKLAQESADLEVKAASLNDRIENLDSAKEKEFRSAKWPVDGLGFGSDGITFSGLPFEQASSAEQLRVAAAIGLAVNPTLPVLLIRDGSLLDDDNLAMLAELAEKHDAQLWVERVGEGEECSVIIEGGLVKQPLSK